MARSLLEGHILSHKIRVLSRKLKPITFSRNWEIRQVCIKDRHHVWQQEIFFVTTCGTLQNAVLGKNISKHDII